MSIEKLKEVSGELAAAKGKLQAFAQEQGKEAIGQAFSKCFEAPSKITKIVWNQYTPYFNDGDACVFSANDPELFLGGEDTSSDSDEDEDEEDGGGYDTYGLVRRGRNWCDPDSEYNRQRRSELEARFSAEAMAAFVDVWEQLDDEILEAVFGDHSEITVTKDAVTVESYDHE